MILKKLTVLLLFLLPAQLLAQPFTTKETKQWQKRAKTITIIRDKWGVPHIYGKTDADAVFGLLYAQCEDDFARVESNYIIAMGRVAEVHGESELYNDLVTRLLSDSLVAISRYKKSPVAMKKLLEAFADGCNYYLYTHPAVKPALIKRFQPWMPLLFPEGSIGGNRSSISIERLKKFYNEEDATGSMKDNPSPDEHSTGSNGFAIAPSRSVSKNSILLINPHTSFYFRSEVHAVSDEGLNVYGAVTWGQFFVYQGFNANCGWMHTTSRADAIDEYAEKIVRKNDSLYYQYDNKLLPVKTETITIAFKGNAGQGQRKFKVFRTHHGPVVGAENERWITFKMLDDPLAAITQSYMRTKSKDMAEFKKWMELKTNTSNGTTYADNKGNIAYWHGNFVPRRDPTFDWSEPVDGSIAATEWKGLHDVSEIVQIVNPGNGWIQNCNSTPFTGAGPNSPKKENYPAYMAPDNETTRAINAVRLLSRENQFTIDKVIEAAYDRYLASFEVLLPPLFKAYENSSDSMKAILQEPVRMLQAWDMKSSVQSQATTLAITWATKMRTTYRGSDQAIAEKTSDAENLKSLSGAMEELSKTYGSWKLQWGDVNRYQRLTGKMNERYDDSKASLPVALASGAFGSLPSYSSRKFPGATKYYGTVGNSFIAVVEFGTTVKAKTIVTGGQSSDPSSKHFTDQAEGFLNGKFKDVFFYREDVERNVERKYHPG